MSETKLQNGGGDGAAMVRKPTRPPPMILDDDDSNDSFSVEPARKPSKPPIVFDDDSCDSFSTEPSRMSTAEVLRKARLTRILGDDEEIEIVEREVDEDDEFGEDDEIIFEEVDESEKTDNFKKVSEIIKTVPHLQFEKSASDVKEWDSNQQMIVVPPSDNEKPLHERFNIVCNREMKYSLNHYWQTYNFLKRNQEGGLEFIQKLKDSAKHIAERAKKTAVRKIDNTVSGKIAKAQEDEAGQVIDPEFFWRENLQFWMNQFEWKRRDGPDVSQEDLDKEIEEYMAARSASRASVCGGDFDIDADLADFMEKKGIIREDKEDLDADLDDYWSKKSKLENGDAKENQDIDPAAKSKGWIVSGTNKMTPQEIMRRRKALDIRTNEQTNSVPNGLSGKDLDEQMDMYHARKKLIKERKEKEQSKAGLEEKAAETARQLELAKRQEGDLFADEDFDVYQDAMDL